MRDDETIQQQLALLATHRRTLSHLVLQAAQYGGEVFSPTATVNGLSSTRTAVAHIKTWLRENGVNVEDELNDIAFPQSSSRPPSHIVHGTKDGNKMEGNGNNSDKVMSNQRTHLPRPYSLESPEGTMRVNS